MEAQDDIRDGKETIPSQPKKKKKRIEKRIENKIKSPRKDREKGIRNSLYC